MLDKQTVGMYVALILFAGFLILSVLLENKLKPGTLAATVTVGLAFLLISLVVGRI